MKERNYDYEVKIVWCGIMPALSKSEALKMIQESFYDQYNIDVSEREIKIRKAKNNG